MKKVFIDGSAGTTGLRIKDRLKDRKDIQLISLTEDKRKDLVSRKTALNQADVAILCLPDQASVEAVSLIKNENTVVIDTSTAHRTLEGWAYGFPELSDSFKQKIKNSKRIAVPGCHASGFIALIFPLIENGILPKDALLSCNSLTGFSGGGKQMIAEYNADATGDLTSPRQYGITQNHKHLKEMVAITDLSNAPVFCPIVSSYYAGMEMTVAIHKSQLNFGKTIDDIKKVYKNKYVGPIVEYKEKIDQNGFISAETLSGKDNMEISVCGNEDRILLVARYDNLGKGASGSAVELLNMVLDADETEGLDI